MRKGLGWKKEISLTPVRETPRCSIGRLSRGGGRILSELNISLAVAGALVPASESADKTSSAYCIQGLAAVAGERGEPHRAARLLGAAEGLLKAAGVPVYVTTDHDLHQRVRSAARERLGEKAWTVAWDEGQAMGFEEAVAYALERKDDVTGG